MAAGEVKRIKEGGRLVIKEVKREAEDKLKIRGKRDKNRNLKKICFDRARTLNSKTFK